MIQVDVRDAVNKLNHELGYVSQDKKKLAIARAINHTIAKGKTEISRRIRDIYAIDAKTVGQALTQIKADRLTLTGKAVMKGKPLPLHKFRARQTAKGVSLEIKKGKRKLIPGVFLAGMKSGHKGVMFRGHYSGGKMNRRKQRVSKTGNDLPITQMVGVSLPSAMSNKIIIHALNRSMSEMFPKRFEHEIKRVALPI